MKLAPIAIGLLATASLASPALARGTLHLLHPARSPLNDCVARKLDPLLAAEQMQQHQHALARTQAGEQANLIVQRTAGHPHPHARCEPARLR